MIRRTEHTTMAVENHSQGVYGRADSNRVARGLVVDEPAGVESDRIGVAALKLRDPVADFRQG